MKGDDGMKKNKIYSAALFGIGVLATVLSKDATLLVIVSLIAIPTFFSKEDWID